MRALRSHWLGWSVTVSLLAAPGMAVAQSSAESTASTIERELVNLSGRLKLLGDFIDREADSQVIIAQRRFSEAQTQFLLDNYEACSTLLGEAVDVAAYHSDPTYPQALYYLAESLYQQGNFRESRRYFREAARRLTSGLQYQDSIERLIALAVKTGDNEGVDEYYAAASKAGVIRPTVRYVYAKWTSRRQDLAPEIRASRADAEFALVGPNDPPYAQALYFRGAIAVSKNDLVKAREYFDTIVALPAPTEKASPAERVRSLAHLALARINYEEGKNAEAVEQFKAVDPEAPEYIEMMFELASTFVKLGDFQQALRTAETLQFIGRDGDVVPEAVAAARILQGNLLLKRGDYEKANATFNDIIQSYGPVRDQIRASIERPDPIGYFDELLRRNEKGLDIETLLPAPARPWARTNQELAGAQVISTEIAQSKEWLADARGVVDRLIEKLATGSLETFAEYQDGNGRAVQISNTLVAYEDRLVEALETALRPSLPPDLTTELEALAQARKDLADRIAHLPKDDQAMEERRGRINTRVFDWERQLKKTELALTGMQVELRAMEYYLRATRSTRSNTEAIENELLADVRQNLGAVEQMDLVRLTLLREIRDRRLTADATAAGGALEDQLRADYGSLVERMQALVAKASGTLSDSDRVAVERLQRSRVEVARMQKELVALRTRLREKALQKLDDTRRKVLAEQRALDEQEKAVTEREGESRQLLGKIAYASFSRLARQFYDVVLKADVGLIDVAWSRKQQVADRIAKTAENKKEELEELADQFKDVLNDVE